MIALILLTIMKNHSEYLIVTGLIFGTSEISVLQRQLLKGTERFFIAFRLRPTFLESKNIMMDADHFIVGLIAFFILARVTLLK